MHHQGHPAGIAGAGVAWARVLRADGECPDRMTAVGVGMAWRYSRVLLTGATLIQLDVEWALVQGVPVHIISGQSW